MMRMPQRANTRRQASAAPIVLPAPVKGWMPASPLPQLPPDGAALMDNWVPEPDCIRPRGGAVLYVGGLGGPVDTFMQYNAGAKVIPFAAAAGRIWDVTDPVAAAVSLSNIASTRFQHLNYATSGGTSLLVFNGEDTPRRFNGTAWSTLAFTFAEPTAAVPVERFFAGVSYAARLFLIATDSATLYYLASPDTFQGALSTFNLGAQLTKGGTIAALGRWTNDTGLGPDDSLVIVSTEGEVIVYSGTNPSDPSAWSIVGTYQVAKPIGRRCLERVGGDLVVLTVDGLVQMSRITTLDKAVQGKKSLTANIRPAIVDAAERYGTEFGWSVYADRDRAWLIVNVAKGIGRAEQFVMNMATGAWTRFTGWDALSWGTYAGRLFYGTQDGRLVEADVGFGDLGKPTVYPLIGGFTAGLRVSQASLIRATLMTSGAVPIKVGVSIDYVITLPGSGPTAELDDVARWDHALWDISRWASARYGAPADDWVGVDGAGRAFAPAVLLTLDGTTPANALIKLVKFDLAVMRGEGLL